MYSFRVLHLALVAGLTLIAAAPLQAQGSLDDLIFANGFEQPLPNCNNVAPTEIQQQTNGHWYLRLVYQGYAGFTNILTTQSDAFTPWPGTQPGAGRNYLIGASSYVAMRFNTGSTPVGRIGSYGVTQSSISPAASYMSISECPGDFRTGPLNDSCEMTLTGKGALYWIVGQASGFRCVLDQYKTYYLNIVLADPANITVSSCANSSCGIMVVPNH